MNVCYVVTLASATSRYGGPFDVVREQMRLVSDDGVRVELVAGFLADDRGPDAPVGASSYRRVRRWLPTRDFTALMSVPMLVQLWRSIGRADVVHVGIVREAIPIAAVAVAVIRRRPVVAQPHGMLTSRTSRAHDLIDRGLRPLVRRVAHWITLTPTEERQLAARFGDSIGPMTSIGNPVPFEAAEIEHLRTSSAPERRAVFVARLHPRKRVLDFAAAAAAAHEAGWDDRYLVHGPDQGDLPALLDRVGETPNLTYGGSLDNAAIPALLADSGAFVLTSQQEPWGNVLAAAAALGVPTVLTRSSALAEVLEGDDGVRIVADDDTAALAAAVHEALDAGRAQPSQRFDRSAVREALLAVYASAAGTGART